MAQSEGPTVLPPFRLVDVQTVLQLLQPHNARHFQLLGLTVESDESNESDQMNRNASTVAFDVIHVIKVSGNVQPFAMDCVRCDHKFGSHAINGSHAIHCFAI